PLLRRVLGASDPRLRARGLDWLVDAVRQLAATPSEALALMLPLSQDEDPTIRARALEGLAHGWLRCLAPADERERARALTRALRDEQPEGARAAVASAAALGRRDGLRARILEDDLAARPELLDALGPLAEEEDLELALALAEHEPLRFGPPARRTVLRAHRHGAFVRVHHLDPLLAGFDADPEWTGEALVRVTHLVRDELVERLAALPPDDPRWIRRASILAASVGTRAAAQLHAQLERVRDLAVAQALIEAAGRCPEYEGEAPLLD